MPALKALSFIVHISLYLSLSFYVSFFPRHAAISILSLSLSDRNLTDPTYDSLILFSLDTIIIPFHRCYNEFGSDSTRIALDSSYFLLIRLQGKLWPTTS